MKVNNEDVGAISKVTITNENGTKEELEQALIIDYSLEDGEIEMGMRFFNLEIEDINNIFLGFSKGFSKSLSKEG